MDDGRVKLRYLCVVSSSPVSIEELKRRLGSRIPVVLSASQRASVAIILGQTDSGLQVLLIRRAEHPADPWSGHMALPGGRRDPSDADDLATALRETLEEVGLDLAKHGVLLGRLDDIAASARGYPIDMVITPFVFTVKTVTPIVTAAEVVSIHWAPILALCDGSAATSQEVDLPGGRATLPAWNVHGNIVWGLTYRMMENLLYLMRASSPDTHPCP